ncbi:MAG: tubulin-like doman-containing protein, partial [Pirellulales bacterium]
MSQNRVSSKEPIPGYKIVERLGSGGYGEVWKVIAPGEIEKAIKIVYGYYDEDRAARERRALNRIKEVRHPFLLSLDRIEIIDGQLVIVTELADMSLKDRFLECQRSGAGGIARDELLIYLRDAADALDYMSEHCGLQHLDVKPENLLLVGGRVKVADFGLVRDVRAASVSLMGGLTPIYAPPEVFEGRPGMRSDQYSLAIVYQEMLTSALPFSGASAAQLMAQHLQERPDLTLLSEQDRPTIARALSKSPEDRFANCRTMVEQLLRHGTRRRPASGPEKGAADRGNSDRGNTLGLTPSDIDVADTPPPKSNALGGAPSGIDVADTPPPKSNALGGAPSGIGVADTPPPVNNTVEVASVAVETTPDIIELPPLDATGLETDLRPTLFVGIGGVAGRTLRGLRRRLHRRFGNPENIPSLQMVLFDTDLRAILQATAGGDESALSAHQTVALPLRRIQEYRSDSSRFLRWLSRRWLYNIPRSLKPEGRRPLGRLALVDHADQIMQCLRKAIATMTSAESRQVSSQVTGRSFDATTPRLFVVASISGGTGSGMVLDMAYAIRKVLADLGLSDRGLRGILLHATPRGHEAHDLAIANACACLSELKHYSHPSLSYPGAAECGLPQSSENDVTFPHTYLVHMGDELSEVELERAAEQVAEYLYLDAATPVGSLLDQCREAETEAIGGSTRLRSFGIHQMGNQIRSVADETAESLCRHLLIEWSGHPAAAEAVSPLDPPGSMWVEDPSASQSAEPETAGDVPFHLDIEPDLEFDSLCRELSHAALDFLDNDLATWSQTAADDHLAAISSKKKGSLAELLLAETDAVLAPFHSKKEEDDRKAETWHDRVDRCMIHLRDGIQHGIDKLMQTDGARLPAARGTAASLLKKMDNLRDQTVTLERRRRSEAEAFRRDLVSAALSRQGKRCRSAKTARDGDVNDLATPLAGLAGAHVAQIVAGAVRWIAHTLTAETDRLEQQLRALQRDLNRVAAGFEDLQSERPNEWADGQQSDAFHAWLTASMCERLPALEEALRRRFDDDLLPPHQGLIGLFSEQGSFGTALASMLRNEAQSLVDAEFRKLDLVGGVLQCEPPSDDGPSVLGT